MPGTPAPADAHAPVAGACSASSGRLERLRARDPAAQEELFRERRSELEALARAILCCRVDAAALVADVFTDFFFRYVDTLRDDPAVFAYLKMMTIRRARRQNELHQRHDSVDDHEELPAVAEEETGDVDARIWAGWLDGCLEGLPPKTRRLLRLRFGHDLDLGEIGTQFGVSKQAVSKTIQKSLTALKRCLEAKRAGPRRAERSWTR